MKSIPLFDNYPVTTVYTDLKDFRKSKDGSIESYLGIFAKQLKAPPKRIVEAKESHSGNILLIDRTNPEGRLVYVDEAYTLKDAGGHDSIITSLPEVMVAIRTADCVPVYLYDPVNHIAAIVHSGWRGTLSAITINTIRTMQELFHTSPRQLIAAFGPCICSSCYEVGTDVYNLFNNRYNQDVMTRIFSAKGGDKYFLDVKEAIRSDLEEMTQSPMENLYDTGICNYESEMYPSYRREKIRNIHRQILSGIMLGK